MARRARNAGDELLTLAQAAAVAGVTRVTLWRWARGGVRGVKLATVKAPVGKALLTSRDAIAEFRRQADDAASAKRLDAQAALAGKVREMSNA